LELALPSLAGSGRFRFNRAGAPKISGEALAISIPRIETAVIRHFQERMPYGLFVPDVP